MTSLPKQTLQMEMLYDCSADWFPGCTDHKTSSHFSRLLIVTLHSATRNLHFSVPRTDFPLMLLCRNISWIFLPHMLPVTWKIQIWRDAHLIKKDSNLLLQQQLLKTVRKMSAFLYDELTWFLFLTSRSREYPRPLPPKPSDPKEQQHPEHMNPRKTKNKTLNKRLSHTVVFPEANILAGHYLWWGTVQGSVLRALFFCGQSSK